MTPLHLMDEFSTNPKIDTRFHLEMLEIDKSGLISEMSKFAHPKSSSISDAKSSDPNMILGL